jgi:hypothetical protein
MTPRRKEAEGKPFLRVPIKKPVPAKPKAKPAAKKEKGLTSEDLMKDAVERGNREQAREADIPKRAKGGKVMKHANKAGRALVKKSAMGRAMMAEGGATKKYAKGGKIDGCATKGKTKTKMVKMAMGGAMGRAMRPNMMSQDRGGPARGRLPMMAKGGKAKGKSC